MKVSYTGKTQDFTPQVQEKVEAKLSKLSKMLEQRGEREAHVIVNQERYLQQVEITCNFYDHSLVGAGSASDLSSALQQAVEKIEKQAVKLRTKWRDTHRDPKGVRAQKESWDGAVVAPAAEASSATVRPKIFRINYNDGKKPMTLEEALIEMEKNVDYIVYQDCDKSCLSVLIRRPDGNFDLIES